MAGDGVAGDAPAAGGEADAVAVAVSASEQAFVGAGELLAAVVDDGLGDAAGGQVEVPVVQVGRAFVGPVGVGEEHALVADGVDDDRGARAGRVTFVEGAPR